ncbi:winged helix-turn-helix domain-containing protein [Actinopolymorpha pittospori]|uniref:DNA-binding transcriptional regulator YhcF (GntR family) n=1 Tax=Actinopolymorpha pittospori TaxID=648752 RepID=A0A927RI67_9ACTN|nr:DNA-binding transcriptional regulator YhcF (GntR family) [Actinopolymorpha pittospori]
MAQPVANTDPPSVRILTEIRRRIATGELRAGDRVPSTRQITQQWGVAMATATKVLTALREEGLVRVVPGVGTVVDAAAGPSHRRTPPPSRWRGFRT